MNPNRKGFAQVNVPVLTMSLVLSVVLWGVVYSQESTAPPETAQVQLVFSGLKPNLALVNQPSEISVVVTATADQLKEIKHTLLSGRVDLSQAKAGRGRYGVALPAILRDVTTPSLPQIDLQLEPVERRWLPVGLGTKGRILDPNIVLVDRYWVPKKVLVSGPQSQMAKVAEARVTLDLSKLNPENPTPYNDYIFLYDTRGVQIQELGSGLAIDPPDATVTTVFNSAPQTRTMAVQVQFKGQPNSGYMMDNYVCKPPYVTVTGTSSALARQSSVKTAPIDVTGLTRDHQFTIPIELPSGFAASAPPTVKVRIIVRPSPPVASKSTGP